MYNQRKIEISALNIAMHAPHSPQRYIDLFFAARRLNHLVQLGSVQAAILGSVSSKDRTDPKVPLIGEIYRFVRIDPSEPWFNLATREPASEEEMGKISIPADLSPSLRRIEFVFDAIKHRLWFISSDRKDTMGTQQATRFFEQLFERTCLASNFPKVEVTALPDKKTLENMLAISTLDSVTISLKRPNPDDAEELDARFLKMLEDQQISSWHQEYRAEKGESIKPSQETRNIMEVASRNGFVAVKGRDGAGKPFEESTTEKPLKVITYVNSDQDVAQDVLIRTAYGLSG